MANFLSALPSLIGAITSIKNLKSPSTVAGTTAATTGTVVGNEVFQIDPTTPAGMVYYVAMAFIFGCGLLKDARKNAEG